MKGSGLINQRTGAHDVFVPTHRCGREFAANLGDGVSNKDYFRRSVLDAPLANFPMPSTVSDRSTQAGHVAYSWGQVDNSAPCGMTGENEFCWHPSALAASCCQCSNPTVRFSVRPSSSVSTTVCTLGNNSNRNRVVMLSDGLPRW
jgi:hypothetical protein